MASHILGREGRQGNSVKLLRFQAKYHDKYFEPGFCNHVTMMTYGNRLCEKGFAVFPHAVVAIEM